MTINILTKAKKAVAINLAENSLNLVTGLAIAIFMVLDENSPANTSIATSAVKSGRIVFANTDKTINGNWGVNIPNPF